MRLIVTVFLMATMSLNADEAIEPEAARAASSQVIDSYKAVKKKANDDLMALSEREEGKARSEGDFKKVEEVQHEQELFRKTGRMPLSIGDSPLFSHFRRIWKARRILHREHQKLVATMLSSGQDALAAELDQKFQEFRVSDERGWLRSGESILRGDALLSGNGSYELKLERNGALVCTRLEPIRTPIWTSKTAGKGVVSCTLRRSGNLVLARRDGSVEFQTGTKWGKEGKLVLQGRGNLILFDYDARPLWASNTNE
ncbi:MAG: hypothetical protein ABGZ53_36530 [Fuerstiella sp.]